ncbi:MAG: rubrerythrin family protein [Melioribacteraceae bacterium]|nr:rubrerythrin family protein [Melioribacteraceae bacterium]
MAEMTKGNLADAFAGESQASVKYAIYAEKAEKEGFPEVARLFRAISYAEQVHAGNHLKVLGGIKKTAENLEAAREGEHFEIEEMYPAYNAVAELQEQKQAVRSIKWALETEKIHEKLYEDANVTVEEGKDIGEATVWICTVCGHTHVGDEAPETCPFCNVKSDKYRKF